MKTQPLSMFLAIAATIALSGCGVSSGGQESAAIDVAIASAPSAMYVNDHSTISVTTNDSAGVTWSCAPVSTCGAFAASQTMNAAANIYTAPAQIPSGNLVTLTATSVTDSTKNARAQVTINAASGIQVAWNTFPSSPLMVTGTEPLEVQVQGDSANAGINFSCMPLMVCGSFSQITAGPPQNGIYVVDMVYTAPANVPPGMVATLFVTSNADNAQSVGTPVTIVNPISTVSTLSGTFAFMNRGIDANGFNGVAGSVTLDGQGNVTTGEFDSADPSAVISAAILPTGSVDINGNPSVSGYTLDQFGHGILTLDFNYNGTVYEMIYSLTATSSSHAMLSEVDEMGDLTGTLDLQSGNFSAAQFAGNYSFVSAGENIAKSVPMNFGGIFTADGSSSISSGTLDINAAGTYRTGPLTASFTPPDSYGRGTLTFSSASPVRFAYYIVEPEVIRLVEIDAITGVTAGSAYGQGSNSSVNDAQVAGNYVFAMHGYSVNGANEMAGQFVADGSGNFAGVLDSNDAGTATLASPLTGATYSFSGNARGSVSSQDGTFTANVYMTDPNINLLDPSNPNGGGGGLMLETDANAFDNGLLTAQTAGNISGNYAMGWRYRPGTVNGFANNFDVAVTAALAVGPGGTFSGEGEWDVVMSGLAPDQPMNGTLAADANNPGRYVGQFSPSPDADLPTTYYQINDSQLVTIEMDSAVADGFLVKQNLP
ncbi:MAG: hypothetical protein ACRD3P_05805 [Terriglobales bacterium]